MGGCRAKNKQTVHLMPEIHTQLHVSAALSYPQAAYSYVTRQAMYL